MADTKKLVPKRRFKEFRDAGDWEQRKIGELSDIVRGASPRPIKDPKWFDNKSEVGWLRIADVTEQDGRVTFLEQRISKAGQEKTRVLYEPHLLLSIAATVGKPVVNYVKTGVHDGFLIFLNPKSDQEFMFQWFEMFRPKWQQFGQPGSQVNLNSDLVKNTSIMLPKEDEQAKIGNHFKNLDNLITLHQRKLDKIKSLKKAYLSEMFPAEGETKPKRRFKGFSGDWEQCKLGKLLLNIGTGKSKYIIHDTQSTDTPYPILGSRSIIGYDNNYDYTGDFILTARVGENAGKLYRYSGNAKITDNTVFMQSDSLVFNFYLLLHSDLTKLSFGSGQPLIKASELKGLEVVAPKDNEEKNQIANFFTSLDNLITLHQSKLDKLKNLKKSYLNEMFI
ncbi:MAG: restriction endonuclease subunit S [Spirochaetales bacterium]|nr:restriction endonuclease subunit S [Spirochaetales bacterium]